MQHSIFSSRYLEFSNRYSEGADHLTVNRLDERRVLLTLCGRDMSDFKLSFAQLGMDDDHSRRIILRLISLACRKSGIDARGKRLSVEALKMGEGCCFLVTVKEKRRRYIRRRGSGECFEFECAEDFLNAVEAAYRLNYCLNKNSAYEWAGSYYLIFDYPAVPKPLRRVLGEFSVRRGKALLGARVREQGRELCARGAISVIGAHLI